MPQPPPLRVERMTRDIVHEIAAIAMALPYRSSSAIDAERVFWIDVAGRERVGIAYTVDEPGGPYWMIAIARSDRRRAGQALINEVLAYLTGGIPDYEIAPTFDGAPEMTMLRLKADDSSIKFA